VAARHLSPVVHRAVVVHVSPVPLDPIEDAPGTAGEALASAVRPLRAAGIPFETHVLSSSDWLRAVLDLGAVDLAASVLLVAGEREDAARFAAAADRDDGSARVTVAF
jgi:hypothetical protein